MGFSETQATWSRSFTSYLLRETLVSGRGWVGRGAERVAREELSFSRPTGQGCREPGGPTPVAGELIKVV